MMQTKNFATIGLSCSLLLGAAQANALNIMMANDDGCTNPAIVALSAELRSRGHNVTVFAPASEQSGQSGRLSLPHGACSVRFDLEDKDMHGTPVDHAQTFCVTATSVATSSACTGDSGLPIHYTALGQTISASPADSAKVGLTYFGDNKPDLVITGINPGENLGATTVHSGTVGSAMTAIHAGIPTIATSIGVRRRNLEAYQSSAVFVADLVAELEQEAQGGRLLPKGMGLNINFPGVEPKGVLFTEVGVDSTIDVEYQLQDDGSYVAAWDFSLDPLGVPVDEIVEEGSAHREGYISISTFQSSYNATSAPQALTRLKLRNLQ